VKYHSGEKIRLWDRVKMWEGCTGIVVFSIDSDEYSHAFPKEHWSYLERGVMFATSRAGLVHSSECDKSMELIKRGGPPSAEEWGPIERSCSEQGGTDPPSVDELYKKDSPIG
jgi:hypothetical protein